MTRGTTTVYRSMKAMAVSQEGAEMEGSSPWGQGRDYFEGAGGDFRNFEHRTDQHVAMMSAHLLRKLTDGTPFNYTISKIGFEGTQDDNQST